MNIALFIAKHFHYNYNKEQLVSKPAIRIATLGVTIGVAVIILAVSIILGFKQEIQNKVTGFGSHIQITNFDSNSSFETAPITLSDSIVRSITAIEAVDQVQRYATKPGIVKTDSNFMGIIVKGIGKEYNSTYLASSLISGTTIALNDSTASNEVLVSYDIARKLRLQTGEDILTYFIGERIQVRKFRIVGIYKTDIAEYDKNFIVCDIRQIQRLNQWESNQVSGMEIKLHDIAQLDEAYSQVFMATANRFEDNGSTYLIQTIKDANAQIFNWLDMLDINAWVILVLMLAVAGFNIISGLLILILERTQSIGILKAIGASNWTIRKTFLYQSIFLIGKGMLWGNLIGVSLCLVQHFTHIAPLDAEAYYISYVPTAIDATYWVLINVVTAVVSVSMLIAPSYIITRLSPAESIRFE